MGLCSRIDDRLGAQRGVGATWQFIDDGATAEQIRHAVPQLREVHDGVYVSGHAPLTDWQRWKAATLTAPGTYLGLWSGARFYGFRDDDRRPTTVRREGTGGARVIGAGQGRIDRIKVYPTERLSGDVHVRDDIDAVRPARTLVDLIAREKWNAERMVREYLRREIGTVMDLRAQAARQRGERGVAVLKTLIDRFEPLKLSSKKSDAEAVAAEFLAAAGVEGVRSNEIIAGGEADLVRPDLMLIIELDGPQYHRFPIVDAEKQARWEQAGYVVRRLPTDDVYERQHLLLGAAVDPISAAERAIAAACGGPADILARWDLGGDAARRRADAAVRG